MSEHDESDSCVVLMKQANKAAQAGAESVEGRRLAEGKPREQNESRTRCRIDSHSALERIREAASWNGKAAGNLPTAFALANHNPDELLRVITQGRSPVRYVARPVMWGECSLRGE